MSVATVTSKGQVTIPLDVRNHLGIRPGTRVPFVEAADGSYHFVAMTGSISALSGLLPWSGPPVTIEQMNDAIAGEASAVGNS
ncbi:MAG TPA: AbrB/MazE/SpoVT family DNA-binding domain-containing protein [Microbacterium sp.]|nr:AbrB/MazE/SpoVT family DNA-binding domain-containing protein [Microbacterium sp.]